MAKEYAKEFYRSVRWIKCRQSYIGSRICIDGGLCEECHEQPGFIVHHTVLLTAENIMNADIALNHAYLSYVCKGCHDKYEGHGLGNKKMKPLCRFDAAGQPVSLREIDNPPL